jgi:hypothetical protein
MRKKLVEISDSILEHINVRDASNDNDNIREEIENFKGCAEYFNENFQAFLDEKYFYTACKLSEELAHRINKSKMMDESAFR